MVSSSYYQINMVYMSFSPYSFKVLTSKFLLVFSMCECVPSLILKALSISNLPSLFSYVSLYLQSAILLFYIHLWYMIYTLLVLKVYSIVHLQIQSPTSTLFLIFIM